MSSRLREIPRPPGAGSDEIRNRAQHQDRQSARPRSAGYTALDCRRSPRITVQLAASAPSWLWHIAARTCATARPQLAKADTAFQGASVGQPTEPCCPQACDLLKTEDDGGPLIFLIGGGPSGRRIRSRNSTAGGWPSSSTSSRVMDMVVSLASRQCGPGINPQAKPLRAYCACAAHLSRITPRR